MTFFRKSLFWLIVLVFLGGTLHLLDRRTEESKRLEAVHRQLFPFSQEGITGFWIENRVQTGRIRLVRAGEDWQMTEPLQTRGDGKAVQKFLANTLKGQRDAILFENPTQEQRRELGMDAPEVSLGFEVGNNTAIVRFGKRGPTNNVAYAQFDGDPRIYRVHSDIKEEANKGIYLLRDKTVLALEPTKMVKMELVRTGQPRLLVRQREGRWDMLEPVAKRASMKNVMETLFAIRNAEIKAFVDDPAAGLAAHGLDKPTITLTVVEHDKEEKHLQLLIGAKDRTQRGYFAKRADAPSIFLLDEETVHTLMADATHWQESSE
ncbi:MAG: DUF4340 domain-containing protein [Magnetococcus sp. DMHC-8]